MWLTKCSVSFLYLRLSAARHHNLASKIALVGTTVLSLLVSIFVIALSCDLAHPWLFILPKCTDLVRLIPYRSAAALTSFRKYTRWLVFAVLDIFTEVVLFALAFYIFHGLHMSWTRKVSVLVTFGLRLLVIVAIAFRLHYLRLELTSDDPTHDGFFASIWTQVEMTYGILAATFPCSRSFIRATSTQLPIEAKIRRNTNYAGGRSKNNITLNSLSKWKKAKRSVPVSSGDIHAYPKCEHTTSVASPGDEHSVASDESSRGFIRKDSEWAVNYEEFRGMPVQL